MALGIYTGGTANATNGTLVSSSNKITFTALSPSYITAHVRTDTADTYTSDQAFTIPTGVEISFDSGTTWKGVADSPYTYPLPIGDLNQAMRIRQTAIQVSSAATLDTTGTFSSCTALADVTSFTATSGDGQVTLSWAAVTNRTYYEIQGATDSGFTTNLTTLTSTETSTSYTVTSLTNGTTYYFRIKAVGTGAYKDSANYATANATPVASWVDNFTRSDGAVGNSWTAVTSSGSAAIATNRLRLSASGAGGLAQVYRTSDVPSTSGGISMKVTILPSSGGNVICHFGRTTQTSGDLSSGTAGVMAYVESNPDGSTLQALFKITGGGVTIISAAGGTSGAAGTIGSSGAVFELRSTGSSHQLWRDGTKILDVTDGTVSATSADKAYVRMYSAASSRSVDVDDVTLRAL